MQHGQRHQQDRHALDEELHSSERVEAFAGSEQVEGIAEVEHVEAHHEQPVDGLGQGRAILEHVVQEGRSVPEQRPGQPGGQAQGHQGVSHVHRDRIPVSVHLVPPS